jgi:hypothetical protein
VREIIETLAGRNDTVFMNGSQMLDWYLSVSKEK